MSINHTKAIQTLASPINRDLTHPQQHDKEKKNSPHLAETGHNRSTEQVILSEQATQLLSATQYDTYPIDEKKVAEMKQTIRDGKLTIDIRKITDGIIRQEFQPTNRQSTTWGK